MWEEGKWPRRQLRNGWSRKEKRHESIGVELVRDQLGHESPLRSPGPDRLQAICPSGAHSGDSLSTPPAEQRAQLPRLSFSATLPRRSEDLSGGGRQLQRQRKTLSRSAVSGPAVELAKGSYSLLCWQVSCRRLVLGAPVLDTNWRRVRPANWGAP